MHTKFSSGNLEGKTPLARPVRRWEHNIRIDGWEGVLWVYLAQKWNQWWALLNMVINFRVPQKAENYLAS